MNIFQKIINFIFPEKCSGCGEYGNYLCENCLKNFSERSEKFFNVEKNFLEDKKIFEKIYSPFFYQKNPILKKILKEIKYKNKFSKFSGLEEKIFLEFEKFLNQVFTEVNAPAGYLYKKEKYDIFLIPTPLHWKKHLKRGFNQSEIFCDRLEEKWLEKKGKQNNLNLKKINLIQKIKNTKSQAQSTKNERLNNQKGVFKIKNFAKKIPGFQNKAYIEEKPNKDLKLKNPRIKTKNQVNIFIIVDDILSTGETMKNCAVEIKKEFKNSLIYGFTICSDFKK